MAIFRKVFRRPNLNSNMDANTGSFGKGIFVVLGLAIILVLAAGAYMYGQQKNSESDEAATKPNTQQQAEVSQTPKAAGPAVSQQPATTSQTPRAQSPAPVQNPSAQPNTASVPNTGPEDFYPLAVSLIVLVGWYYIRARKSSSRAELFQTR